MGGAFVTCVYIILAVTFAYTPSQGKQRYHQKKLLHGCVCISIVTIDYISFIWSILLSSSLTQFGGLICVVTKSSPGFYMKQICQLLLIFRFVHVYIDVLREKFSIVTVRSFKSMCTSFLRLACYLQKLSLCLSIVFLCCPLKQRIS